MAVTTLVYGLALQSILSGEVNFTAGDVKCMLCSDLYTPDQDAHRYASDVTGEVVGTGYAAGGLSLTGKAVTYDAATNTLKLTATNLSWPASTITARYAVFYVNTGTPATSPLLCVWDFGSDVTSTTGPFDVTFDAAGLLNAVAA